MGSKYVGRTFTNSKGLRYKVLSTIRRIRNDDYYTDYRIKFLETGYENIVQGSALRRGHIRDPLHKKEVTK